MQPEDTVRRSRVRVDQRITNPGQRPRPSDDLRFVWQEGPTGPGRAPLRCLDATLGGRRRVPVVVHCDTATAVSRAPLLPRRGSGHGLLESIAYRAHSARIAGPVHLAANA